MPIEDPSLTIKVTRIRHRWHARLYSNDLVVDEMACECTEDIGVICKTMMRWYCKLGGVSTYASATRHRDSSFRRPCGRIWYRGDLEYEKAQRDAAK